MRTVLPLLTIRNGFVYLKGLKICRYIKDRQELEFIDTRATGNQIPKVKRVKVEDLAEELRELIKRGQNEG